MTMKIKLTTIGSLLILCLAALSVRADIILSDDFTYSNGALTNVSGGKWVRHSGTGNDFNVVSGTAQIAGGTSSGLTDDVNSTLTNQPYASTNPVAVLYASFTINLTTTPSGAGTYFAHFKDSTTGFRCKLYTSTNGVGTFGNYRIGIANTANSVSTNVQTDLIPGTTYTIVVRYVLSTGISTLWLGPANESSPSATASDAVNTSTAMTAFAMRQSTGEGILFLDNLLVGTTFADVVPSSAGSNSPLLLVQPADVPSISEGSTATFTSLAVGDPTLVYQWYYNTNQSPAWLLTNGSATTATLTLTNALTNYSGTYSCVVTNGVGSNTTRYALLNVSALQIPPGITNQPQSQTNVVFSTVSFTVVAGGSQPLYYYWHGITNGVTNLVGSGVSGTTNTLTLVNVTTNQNGFYYVTVSNQFGTTNSALASLTATLPALTNIAYLRSTLDPVNWVPTNTSTLFRVRGTVTTWNDMTSAGNSSFYIQDATAGIAVFWNAPAATYLPPAGANVEVVGPLSNFGGLLELTPTNGAPYQGVTVLSTGNPLPTPQPLVFDPNIVATPASMEMLEGSYFVASNVFLDLDTGPTFVSGATDPITNRATRTLTNTVTGLTFTNSAGDTFVTYINPYIDIAGKPKYSGPVTIYGILGQHTAGPPFTGGYQFTPSRYADIVPAVRWTNVLENLTRRGDSPTNSFTETVLRPGEKLTMDALATDPAGGNITSVGALTGLPAGASQTTGVAGGKGTAHLVYQAAASDAGSNFTVAWRVTAPTWTSTNYWTIYVPTNYEQQIYITEFLPFSSGSSNSPAFNPLKRAVDTNNFANDRYVEIANLSGTDVDLLNWTLGGNQSVWHTFYTGGVGETLGSSNSYVIYGGPVTDPNPPTILTGQIEAANPGPLGLSTSGGVITLHNQNGGLVDRVVYAASDITTNNDSISRFPTLNTVSDPHGAFVPQSYISTNWVTPGLQYDGRAWNLPTKVPIAISNNIAVAYGNPTTLSFTANAGMATNLWTATLWQAGDITGFFGVVNGFQLTNTSSGVFKIQNPPANQLFWFITTQ
jgi:hypothetical protein